MARPSPSIEIHKFGGAGLADADAIRHAAQIVAARPAGAVVVASAMQGVTDALFDIAFLASHKERATVRSAIGALRKRHLAAAAAFAIAKAIA